MPALGGVFIGRCWGWAPEMRPARATSRVPVKWPRHRPQLKHTQGQPEIAPGGGGGAGRPSPNRQGSGQPSVGEGCSPLSQRGRLPTTDSPLPRPSVPSSSPLLTCTSQRPSLSPALSLEPTDTCVCAGHLPSRDSRTGSKKGVAAAAPRGGVRVKNAMRDQNGGGSASSRGVSKFRTDKVTSIPLSTPAPWRPSFLADPHLRSGPCYALLLPVTPNSLPPRPPQAGLQWGSPLNSAQFS